MIRKLMTSSFLGINTKVNKLLIIILLNAVFIFSNEIEVNDNIAYLEFNGTDYSLYLKQYDGTKNFIIKYPRYPSYEVINDLIRIDLGCGSPCTSTRFFDRSTGEISEGYEVVLAADYERKLIVVSEYDDEIGYDGVVVYDIFNPDCNMRFHLPLPQDVVAVNYQVECEINYPKCSVRYPQYYDEETGNMPDTLVTLTIDPKEICQ